MGQHENEEAQRLFAKYLTIPRYQRRTIRFLGYTFDLPDVTSFLFQFQEIFANEQYNFPCPHQAPLIIDCGANVGTSCLYFKRKYPKARIIAFEADPLIFETLRKNLAANGLEDIDLRQQAVWIHDRGVQFSVEGADGGSIHGKWPTRKKVPSIRLHDLLDELETVDFVKMDLEGAEVEIIPDCSKVLSKVNNIFIEYHSWTDREQFLDRLLAVLKDNGFRYYTETICNRSMPFINHGQEENMDLQLNIFAYQKDTRASKPSI
jgi:FkbM family methyltransferase